MKKAVHRNRGARCTIKFCHILFPAVLLSGTVFYFDELVLENTTTAKTCDEFYSRYPNHKGKIIINGDASGDNRSCTSEYTNYVIIKRKLTSFGYDAEIKIKGFNPPIKNRVAASIKFMIV